MAKQTPKIETPEAAETPAPPSPPISFAEPPSAPAENFIVSQERPEGFVDPKPAPTAKQMEEIRRAADRDNEKREFFIKVQEARKPPAEPDYVPPPLAPRMAQQIADEHAAGRACVARHEEIQLSRGPRPHDPSDGTVTPVFRPADFVPDQKKGQGRIVAQTLK